MKKLELDANASHDVILESVRSLFGDSIPQMLWPGWRLLEVVTPGRGGRRSHLRGLAPEGEDESITMDSIAKYTRKLSLRCALIQ